MSMEMTTLVQSHAQASLGVGLVADTLCKRANRPHGADRPHEVIWATARKVK